MKNNRTRPAYILLVVLAVMVLVVTVLSTLSQISLRRGLAAADAKVRLQQRVGIHSIERVVLSRAAKVFDRLEKESLDGGLPPPPPRQLRSVVTFGGVTFDVLLADEDAKADLNLMYHLMGKQRTESAVMELVGPSVASAVRLDPAAAPVGDRWLADQVDPDDSDTEPPEIPRAFRSWGEVFDLNRLAAVVGDDAALPNVTATMTCFGSGGLNLRRAPDSAMLATLSGSLSRAGADRFVSRYRDNPMIALDVLIEQESKTETDRIKLRRLLSTSSSHFSVWIDASTLSRGSQRMHGVVRTVDDGIQINERFAY